MGYDPVPASVMSTILHKSRTEGNEDTKENLSRVLPQNVEAEMALLGSLILDENTLARVVYKLNEKSFYRTAHQKLFASLCSLYEQGKPIDAITLAEHLRGKRQLEEIGGSAYLSQLLDSVSSTANVDYYMEIVHEKSILRHLIDITSQVGSDCLEPQAEAKELLDRAEQKIFELTQRKVTDEFVQIGDLIKESVKFVEKLHREKSAVTGLPTGFKDIDEKTSGLQNSDFIVIAARPSMGKTSLSLNIAEHVAVVEKLPVGIFSLEMSKEQLVLRMLCSLAQVNAHKVRTGFLSQEDFDRLVTAAGKLAEAPIYIDDTPGISVLEIRAKSRRLKMRNDVRMIIVDYLQLMQSTRRAENRQQEISEISRALKALARELDVPVVVLSQLNRAVESRTDHRPQLSDLRESGAIEQDADVVVMLLRREYYDREDSPGTADLMVAKQRNGPTGDLKLAFREEFTRFGDFTSREEPEFVES